MNAIVNKILLRIKQLLFVAKLLCGWVLSIFVKDKDLWLISERGQEARDNAFFFFVWLKENHPEINSKFIISNNSTDLYKLQKWSDDIIYYKSLNHWISLWKAKYLISTHISGYTPDYRFFSRFDGKFNVFKKKKRVFLQHGVLSYVIESLFANKNHLDLFICGSKIEFNVVKSVYGYPLGVVQYTGLCRFDNLHHIHTKKQILVMPTWRAYINLDNFVQSDYFCVYKRLLCSKRLSRMLEELEYELIFYPHYEFQSKIELFRTLPLSANIKIADMNTDVQHLLKESEILVTDYSSVYFDMIYMGKPIIYYQFDFEKFSQGHYRNAQQTLYIDISKIGSVVTTHEKLLDEIGFALNNKEELIKANKEYYNSIFELKDSKNNERVFNAITKC